MKNKLQIIHEPIILQSSIEKIERTYNCKYVFTTELKPGNDVPVDVFYSLSKDTGELWQYFAIFVDNFRDKNLIVNAEHVVDMDISAIVVHNKAYYSRSLQDFNAISDICAIDGGRSYTRIIGNADRINLKVKRDKLVKV